MSIKIMTAVWDLDLPDSEKLALLALADCANDEGLCWPSMATLARKCSKSDRTLQKAIASLSEKGHLSRDERPGKGVLYRIHPRSDCTPEISSPPKARASTPEAASDNPKRTINSPLPPNDEINGPNDVDLGNQFWRVPEGHSWKETTGMLRELNRKPRKKVRTQNANNSYVAPSLRTSKGYQKVLAAKALETDKSSEIHELLKVQLGNNVYEHWLSNAAILIEPTGITVVTASSFQSSWIEENLSKKLTSAANTVAGINAARPLFKVESAAHG